MGDRVSTGLEMASSGIIGVLYLSDILYYTVLEDCWRIGKAGY
jgi:hypothetical protein